MSNAELTDTLVKYYRIELRKEREALRNAESEMLARLIQESIEYWQAEIEALGY